MQMIVRDRAVLTHNDPPIGLASSNTLITTITTIGSHTITHPLDLDHWYGYCYCYWYGMDIGPCSVHTQSPTHCIFLHLDHHYYHSSLAGTQWEGDSSANIFSSHIIIITQLPRSHIIITQVASCTRLSSTIIHFCFVLCHESPPRF